MVDALGATSTFPVPLMAYPDLSNRGLLDTLAGRLWFEPFNAVVTGIFLLAIVHTFVTDRFTAWAHRVQRQHDARARASGEPQAASVVAELLHFLGEVEVVFGLWALVLLIAVTAGKGWDIAHDYFSHGVEYTEPLFVIVIMALASSRPIVTLAELCVRRLAGVFGGGPAAWWITILVFAPLLGSLITEPAAMTIAAWLLARQFFDLEPSRRLKYATLGLLFVNVSIGGTLTHFAAPPVLMVAGPWKWDLAFMAEQLGWRAAVAVVASTLLYWGFFRQDFRALTGRTPVADVERPELEENGQGTSAVLQPVPAWIMAVHVGFMAWTVFVAHAPALFVGGFLFFLGFVKATAPCQSRLDLRAPLLVGFFLGGLKIHGGLQAWWIAPVLASFNEDTLFLGAMFLTAFNDNALITYLATLVPSLDDTLKLAVVQGAVAGGGLTVIANAPNPAGQALLARFFGGAVSPFYLMLAALIPTLVASLAFRLT